MAFFQKNPVFKNNSKFLIIVRKYGTSNVPNEFLKKSLTVRYEFYESSRESLY